MARSPSKSPAKAKPRPPLLGLFVRGEDWAPIIFSMSPGPNRPVVRNLVNRGGGALDDPKMRNDENNRIRLADPDMVVIRGDDDVFNYKYVLDCVEQNRLLPNLLDYRLGKKSRFQDHDPMDVLLGKKTWNDLRKVDEGNGEACSDFESDNEDTSRLHEKRQQQQQPAASVSEANSPEATVKTQDNVAGRTKRRKLMNLKNFELFADSPNSSRASKEPPSSAESVHFDSDSPSAASPPSAKTSSRSEQVDAPKSLPEAKRRGDRKPYTKDEEVAMLTFIVKHKRHSEIGGNQLWKYMEQKKVLRGRTWQSMKERFRKKVLPNLNHFDLSDSEKEALNERR